MQTKYFQKNYEFVLGDLNSSLNGIDKQDVIKRIKKYGKNSISFSQKRSAIEIFVEQFKNPLVIILILASIISGVLGEVASTIIIVVLVLSSALIAFIQEYKSEKILEKLQKRVALRANVIRGGKRENILSEDLTIGDIVELSPGTVVPADLRIIKSNNLSINESIFTGETFPVEKTTEPIQIKYFIPQSMKNIAFMSTSIVEGFGSGVVIGIGQQTEFGKTSLLLEKKEPQGEFHKGISDFGFFLFRVIIFFSLFVFLFLALFKSNWIESLMFSLAVAVGISPELLPIIITLNLTRGAKKMSHKKVIVKRLTAIENLGNATVFCTDKTGTLTDGKIVLKNFFDIEDKENNEILMYSLLCSEYFINKTSYNQLDSAIFDYCRKKKKLNSIKKFKKLFYQPFTFKRRRMSVLIENKNKRFLIVKGAIQEMFDVSKNIELDGKVFNKKELNLFKQKMLDLEDKGLKVLVIAYKNLNNIDKYNTKDENNLSIIGYLTFFDPPKSSVKQSFLELQSLGVDVKVLTGDSESSAKYLCQQVGLDYLNILSGEKMSRMNDSKLKETIKNTDIFARVTPEQKLLIIKALREMGHTVGFLGDGINDAPALKMADVGISVDNACDVAKESADIILLKKSFLVLIDGIKEGRKTFGNTLKYIFCTISSNFGNIFSVVGAAVFLPFIPALPIQILLLNFVSDFPMLAVSGDSVDAEFIKKPKHWNIKAIKQIMVRFGLVSSFFDYVSFGLLIFVFHSSMSMFQTGWFLQSFLTEVLLIFVIRTKLSMFKSRPSKMLVLSSVFTFLLTIFFIYSDLGKFFGFVKLPITIFLSMIGVAVVYFTITELIKKKIFSRMNI